VSGNTSSNYERRTYEKALIVIMAAFILIAGAWVVVQAATQGKDVSITGKISCTFCNLPASSNCTKECCKACVGSGDPSFYRMPKGTSIFS